MYQIIWLEDAKTEFSWWLKNCKPIAYRIEMLLSNIAVTPESGIGKPEKLKHQYSGYWSRRISIEHRLIYKILYDQKEVVIISCKHHY